MMGQDDLFKSTLGDFAEAGITSNYLAAKALIRAGLAVLIITPGGKTPLCTLTTRQRVTADNAAQRAAMEQGVTLFDKIKHPCGVNHAITDVKDLNKATVRGYLENGANLAVVPHLSPTRMIVVDLDTREECRGFLEDRAEEEPGFNAEDRPMTVTSPGVMTTDVDGKEVWVHKDGGHYWFTLPMEPALGEDGEPYTDEEGRLVMEPARLPEHPGKLRAESGGRPRRSRG